MKKTALVTGANGDLGSAAVADLSRRGYAVIALARDPLKESSQALLAHGDITLVQCNVEDDADTNRCFQSLANTGLIPSAVVMAAGAFKWDNAFKSVAESIEFLTRVNVHTKETVFYALDVFMHDQQRSMKCVLIGSHASRHPEWMDKEAGYVTATQGVARLPEKYGDRFEDMILLEPELINVEKSRHDFNIETLGFEPDWNAAPTPGEYIRTAFDHAGL